jgi:ribulose-5-phosphate 4-epimerase/fuculose-1-phosphate aldolase
VSTITELKRDLAIANRILAREGVVDAYGHISVRNPEAPDRFFLSCSRSPELVVPADIMEFTLDGEVFDKNDKRGPYLERFIHAGVFAARPDVMSVVHNHSYAVVPFTVTKTPLRPLLHTAGIIGGNIPNWDIRAKFGDTNLLVVNTKQGADLAATLGSNTCVLMRGHGITVATRSMQDTVAAAIYAQVNAQLQLDAMQMGEVTYLSDGEVRETMQMSQLPNVGKRVWDYFTSRANLNGI